MKRLQCIARTSALLPLCFAASAMAQATPQLEIDFTNAVVPLSPLLTALIAVTLGGLGLLALRHARAGGRHASWLLAALVAVALAGAVAYLNPISSAQAVPASIFPLTASPATTAADVGVYHAVNNTTTDIVLTAVKLNNPGALVIFSAFTTCTVGAHLGAGGSCDVYIEGTF